MKLKVNEIDYDVVGFDTYTEDYSKAARPDYQNEGEQELINELEHYSDDISLADGEDIVVSLTDEKSVDGKMHIFRFGVSFEDGVSTLNYYGCEAGA